MEDKVSIATCNGMSPLGLIGRVACSQLATEENKVISICITATSANKGEFIKIIKKYPIIAINGCSNNCVNTILKSKDVDVEKTIQISELINEKELKDCDEAHLGKSGQKAVKSLKLAIKNELI